MQIRHRMARFLLDPDGTTSLEYLVMLALIVIAIIGVASFGHGLLDVWQKNGQKLVPVLE